jgi:NAD(P)-dependent dehydrogenase (short-subunit alcohol dehydrogenase family)
MHPVETDKALGAFHPVRRMGEISHIVEAILYLESASFVSGTILQVDGGQSDRARRGGIGRRYEQTLKPVQ